MAFDATNDIKESSNDYLRMRMLRYYIQVTCNATDLDEYYCPHFRTYNEAENFANKYDIDPDITIT